MSRIFLERTNLTKRPPTAGKKKSIFLPMDKALLSFTALMVGLGLIFTYSSSAFDTYQFFKKQLVFDILGLGIMLFLSQGFTYFYKKFGSFWLFPVVWVLLIVALCQPPIENTHRWLNVGFFFVQVSELAKIVVLIYLASFLSKETDKMQRTSPGKNVLWESLIPPMVYVSITLILIYLSRDLGMPVLIGAMTFTMFFIAGVNIKPLIGLFVLAVPLITLTILNTPYRMGRVTSFLDPFKSEEYGYQLREALYTIGSGSWWGSGLGAGINKMSLPEAHTDFIFSVICGELGIITAFVLMGTFVAFLFYGVRLAIKAKDTFNSFLIAGITICLSLQAFISMAVATSALPTKGLALPFFSYGGSSALITLSMMGILMNLVAMERSKSTRQEGKH